MTQHIRARKGNPGLIRISRINESQINMGIKLITFDLDHTLWDPDAALQRGETESYAWLAAQHPAFGEQFPASAFIDLRIQLREQHPELRHRVSEIRRIAFRQALQQTGMPAAEAHLLAEQAFDVFWRLRQQVNIFSDTPALLEQLSKHYALGALSNGNACLNTVGLAQHFQFHFAAEDFPAAKPAPDMFLAALERAGVAPHEALHIGDHPVDDIEGAQAVGMKTLWINFSGKPWVSTSATPDFTVEALPQIIGALQPPTP
jgi:FMN hydrolase / 5-amino-6-(5-phospho-D-ribitylamino)uracil phosphatase